MVQNEQAGPLTLADSMTLPTGVTAEYVEDSLRLSMENGNTTLGITWENVNGERKITLGSAGSPIAAGTYSIWLQPVKLEGTLAKRLLTE